MRPEQVVAIGAALLASIGLAMAESTAKSPAQPPGPTVTPAAPSAEQTQPAATSNEGARALTKEDLDAWLDGFMPYALHQGDVAGGVVVVVKDGAIVTQRGYGYADVKERVPVDPELTLFRPGSVSKLFTWTAVMQLVEQGKVDLDADVNGYIDFKIPERDGKPITLRNILTHTPGFEEQAKGVMSIEEDGVPTLAEHLKRWTPERVYPPAHTPAYSNYATALAGYVVERVSGMPFDDYLDKYLFEPLEMKNSTFRQPLPERLRPQMSKGYMAASLPDKPFEIVGPAPAGSLSAPGSDMANFMIAHLQKGRYGANQILKPETAEQMHTTALTILPRVNRMMLGFYETNYNGRRVIGHGGDTQWFHSYMHLFIDDGVGLFVSVNSMGKDGAAGTIRSTLFREFADRYLPGPAPEGEVDEKTAAEHARMIAGRYVNSRRMHSTFLSMLNLADSTKIIDNGDGTISMSMVTSPSGVPVRWREIEPFVWRQEGAEELLSATVENGRVTRFSFDDISPFMVFDRPSAATSAGWLMPAFVLGTAALLLTTLAWPISALTRRHYRVQYALAGRDAKAHRYVRIASVVVIGALLAWIILIASIMADFNVAMRVDGWIRVLQIIAPIAFIGGAAVGVWNALVVVRGQRRWQAKTWAVALALSFLVILWVAVAFNLISFGVNF